jgi:hypothetical protein
MKMKNKLNILVVSVILIVMASCNSDEFLEEKPFDQLDQAVAFADPSLVNAAVTAGYDMLSRVSYYGRDFIIASEAMADNVDLKPDNSNRFTSEYRYSTIDDDGDATGIYSRIYRAVAVANGIIENIGNCTSCSETQIGDALGHAYALRAIAHFDGVRFFAFPYNTTDASVAPGANGAGGNLGVPYRLSTGTELPVRSTVAENFANIISDLKTAESSFTIAGAPLGSRFSRNAVKALLSRVYLYMEDYANAKSYADQVIGSGIYTLVPNTSYAASWNGLGSSETILQMVYSETDNLATTGLSYIYIDEGYGDFIPTEELLGLYSASDVRNGWFRDLDVTYTYKLPGRDNQPGLNDIPLIRLSEMYLNKAEAEFHLGNVSDAQDALDVVAQRSDATLSDNFSTGATLLNEILTERRKELAFEGHRLFDVNRNKLDMNRIFTGTITYPNCLTIYPVPADETNVNENMVQNECY